MHDRYKFTAGGREPRQLVRQGRAHHVSRRTPADRMDGHRVTLTPGTTLRFSSLDFVYTGPVEPVVGRTFTRPPRPNVLVGVAGRKAFIRGFLNDVILSMLGPNPTQERFRLAAYNLTDLTFQASGDEPLGWGEFMERYTAMYPRGQPDLPDDLVTAYVNNLYAIGTAPGSATTRGHGPRNATTPCGSATSAWPLRDYVLWCLL
jgi:hypothetical protein